MARLRKITLLRMTEHLSPVAREMVERLTQEPERIERNTDGMEVIRSSTPLPMTLLSEVETQKQPVITPAEWLLLQAETHPEQLKWML